MRTGLAATDRLGLFKLIICVCDWDQITVILKHMFHPDEMAENPLLREDLEDDIKTECAKHGAQNLPQT